MSTRSLVLLVCQFRHFRMSVISRDDFLIIPKENKIVNYFFQKNCKKFFKQLKQFFLQKKLDLLSKNRYNTHCSQKWRNWQTRRLQVPVVAISCGFKSHLPHSKFLDKSLGFSRFGLFSFVKIYDILVRPR